MSRTDNTRPFQIQGDDRTVPGRIQHNHLIRHSQFIGVNNSGRPLYIYWSEAAGCDYSPTNGLHDKLLAQSGLRADTPRCQRLAYHPGGRNSGSGFSKRERKLQQRRNRQRVGAQLHNSAREGTQTDYQAFVTGRQALVGIMV